MARNAEKAMTTLARWRASQMEEEAVVRVRRPYLTSECTDLKEADKWRKDVIRQISRKVTQIQNAGLGEHRIRDLNDQINRLLKIKLDWENRIKELGGLAVKSDTKYDAKEVPGNRGYKYFGAAKDLPGVREVLEREPVALPRKTRSELIQNVDYDYYGFRDEDDGVILKEEARVQREELIKAMDDNNDHGLDQDNLNKRIGEICDASQAKLGAECSIDCVNNIMFVPSLPSQEEIHQELLRRKKEELLKKYVEPEENMHVTQATQESDQ